MPRPIKRRFVCSKPKFNLFGPPNSNEYIFLNLEEYETIRLIDYEGMTQEECSHLMNVARTTVQKIYDDARKKIANAMINGKTIKIEGGNYMICDNEQPNGKCNNLNCNRFREKR